METLMASQPMYSFEFSPRQAIALKFGSRRPQHEAGSLIVLLLAGTEEGGSGQVPFLLAERAR